MVAEHVRRAAKRAKSVAMGHTFCSHLAMHVKGTRERVRLTTEL
jgi:hypothetical protein